MLWSIEEVFGDLVVLGVGVGDLGNAGLGKLVDARVGIGEENRRMGGDNQLRVVIDQAVHEGEDA